MQTQTALRIRIALTLMMAMVLSAPTTWAQEKEQSTDGWITKTLKLQHITTSRFRDLLDKVPGTLERDGDLGLLIVYGPPSTVRFVEETVAKVDVPPKHIENRNVEFTAYLLGATHDTTADPNLVPLLEPVVAQLRERFPYRGYRLLETTSLRLRPNPRATSRIQGLIRDLEIEDAQPASYELSVTLEGIQATASGYNISIATTLGADVPVTVAGGSPTMRNIQVRTTMDMQAAETVVVGKAGVQGVVDGIFLILQANVVN